MVTLPADETKADHCAPTPGVLTGEAVATIDVVAPATAVVFCTHVPAVVAVANAALVAGITNPRLTFVPGSGIDTVRGDVGVEGAKLKLFADAVPLNRKPVKGALLAPKVRETPPLGCTVPGPLSNT